MADGGRDAAHRELAPYILLAGLFVAVLILVPPQGDFPLNDDWIYGKVVKQLVETGSYDANVYADPTFIAQAYWGAAFCAFMGLSFETLRVSTLVLGLGAVWATCWAGREAGLSRNGALLAGALVVANPIFMNVSYTFMTDVPFLCFTTLSGAAYIRCLRTNAWAWALVGSVAAIVAFFIRQFGLLPAIAFAPFLFLKPGGGFHVTSPRVVAAFGVPWLVGVAFYAVLPIGGTGLGGSMDWGAWGDSAAGRVIWLGTAISIAFVYVALFIAPVFLAMRPLNVLETVRAHRGAVALGIGVLSAITWLTARDWPHRLPYVGNVLYDFGVGPLLLPGMLEGTTIAAPIRIGWVWWLPTGLGLVFAAATCVLVARSFTDLFKRGRDAGDPRAEPYLILWAGAMLIVVSLPIVEVRFDRYFLMALPPAAIFALRRLGPVFGNREYVVATGFVAAMYLFGMVALQDYLAWNRARWEGLHRLAVDMRVPREQINGGYEFNGWVHSDRYAAQSREEGHKVFGPLGWWIVEDAYCVSLRDRERFETIGDVPYYSWLGFTERRMLIQRRTEPDPGPFPDR